jgi:hypothetical protein
MADRSCRGTAVGLVRERKPAGEIIKEIRQATLERVKQLNA